MIQERNEELARKSAKASEEDIKTLTDEFEARMGVSERKVYALTKERDMLKRGQEKLTSATDLVKEKDNIIAQVKCLQRRRLHSVGTAIHKGTLMSHDSQGIQKAIANIVPFLHFQK